ncbi:metal ABC transporter permease [Glycomyces luteolus]|uniref:Metal ABC transporter permease n=1 Tax=Glycomyces luteolus TaxID=2670330 RepID=A0A9X3P5S8_9ACTN|nr:metal ABC transporter permease [Glycomyces luteolus]MDA1359313.1 metal ABC transporter permease [Glycomyces luteolus]
MNPDLSILDYFQYEFMQRALISALVVGLCAPAVGVFLVQKRLALIGDGLGHIALTGVAIGFLTGAAPMWTTLAVTVAASVVMEILRSHSKTSGDVALAMMFYGGIAGGVYLTGIASDKGVANLQQYLFGSLLTAGWDEVWTIAIGGSIVAALMLVLRPWLAAICADEQYARVSGLPVAALNLLLLITTAVTVSVSMRAVGLLLVSALLVIPVVTVQQFTRSFKATMFTAMGAGFLIAGAGVLASAAKDVPPGSTIVLIGVAVFVVTAVLAALVRRVRRVRRAHLPPEGEPLEVELPVSNA